MPCTCIMFGALCVAHSTLLTLIKANCLVVTRSLLPHAPGCNAVNALALLALLPTAPAIFPPALYEYEQRVYLQYTPRALIVILILALTVIMRCDSRRMQPNLQYPRYWDIRTPRQHVV
jgi:hypothetical protein